MSDTTQVDLANLDVHRILTIAREAGKLQLTYREPYVRQDKKLPHSIKEDGSVVTQADTLSNRYLIEQLSKIIPGVKVISEEQDETINQGILAKSSTFWMVDPLDNTSRYVRGKNEFSINIALVVDGKPVLGVLYFPALDTFYYNDGKGGAFKIEHGSDPIPLKALQHLEVTKPIPIATRKKDSAATAIAPFLGKQPRASFTIHDAYGQMRSCLVAEGVALSCTQPEGYKPWDIAATIPIVEAAGAQIKDHQGNDLNMCTLDSLPAHFVAAPMAMKMLVSHARHSLHTSARTL